MKKPGGNVLVHAPIWVHLELGDIVNGAQQPGCEGISPATPGFNGPRGFNLDIIVHGFVAIFTVRDVVPWYELSDVVLNTLCV